MFFLNFILVLFNIGSHLAVFECISYIPQTCFSFGNSPICRNEIRILFDYEIVIGYCIFVLPERVVEHSTLKESFSIGGIQFEYLIKIAQSVVVVAKTGTQQSAIVVSEFAFAFEFYRIIIIAEGFAEVFATHI